MYKISAFKLCKDYSLGKKVVKCITYNINNINKIVISICCHKFVVLSTYKVFIVEIQHNY